jgi:hypothetical protein
MASKEPSLIRSTKAFSVEIPEGSSSAKAKRSDIVAGELGEIGQSDSHFEEQLAQNALKQTSDNETIDTQQAFGAEQVKADVYAHAQEDASHESLAGNSTDHLHTPTGVGVATDSHKDHLVGVTDEHPEDRLIGISDEHTEDHLIGVAEDSGKDHVVGIGNDASNEHLHAISNEGLQDTHAAVPTDKVEDHHAAIAKDKLEDHLAAVPQDNISDTHAALPDSAIEDHLVAVAATEPIPLFVSSNDDFPDDHMEIEAPPEEAINTQALTDEALVDHVEHVQEGKAKLAEVNLSADVPAPLPKPQAKPVAQMKQPQLVKKAPAALTPEMVKQQQEALLAKQHKMEEFHGRVDAIRKTVNDINSKLDHISPQEKKPH